MNRQVTTGVRDGRSMVVRDGSAPVEMQPGPGFVIEDHWRGPARGHGVLEPIEGFEFAAEPDTGEVTFRLVTLPPGLEPQLHRTETTDLIAIIAGEVVLTLDGEDEVVLQAGDTVVQQGAVHGWANRGAEPARLAVTMLSARGPA